MLTVSETVYPHYIYREFLVHKEDDVSYNFYKHCSMLVIQPSSGGKSVFHFHFKAWPDHGVPQDPGTVLGFLNDINSKLEELENDGMQPGPMIVHCSAGIGRTGTFIVIDVLLNVMEQQGIDNILML